MKVRLVALAVSIAAISCGEAPIEAPPQPESSVKTEAAVIGQPYYGNLPTYSASGHVHVVVEIPAGTNKKIEYSYDDNSFPADQRNGADRIVDYLPYPGNYGFIPSTYMDTARGGDGDALDILVLCSNVPTGTVLEVTPIGVMKLMDNGEIDDKLVALPALESQRVIDAANWTELVANYPAIPTAIENWFSNYKGIGQMEFVGWGDEIEAMEVIQKWLILKE